MRSASPERLNGDVRARCEGAERYGGEGQRDECLDEPEA